MAMNPEKQRQRRNRGSHHVTKIEEGENTLLQMQSVFDQFDGFSVSFRKRVLAYCGWSNPTYYRKKKSGNLTKQEIANLNIAFTTVLKEIFIITSDLVKIMPPEDVVKWTTIAALMGFDGKEEFHVIPERLRTTIDEEN